MSNPARLQSGNGIPITQTSNALDVNIKSGSSGLPTGAATSAKQDTGNASLASISADIATVKADIALVKADVEDIEILLETTGITLLPLSATLDSIDVSKKSKGAVTTAHSAITGTATSAEIDCSGFNSVLVHWVSNQTDKTWVISVTGAMGSGLTFVPLLDKTTGLAASEITTDISGFFVISNIPDYIKIVATETDDGATCTCKVQPFNS